tara:strand:- start:2476 stop:3198 length:723 start_codon:yes stop_codon:yes gene_type:complete
MVRARARTVRWAEESATGDPTRSYSTFVAERDRAEARRLAARSRALARARATEFRYPKVILKLRMEGDGSAASAAATLTTLAATTPQAPQGSHRKRKKPNRNGGKVKPWQRHENKALYLIMRNPPLRPNERFVDWTAVAKLLGDQNIDRTRPSEPRNRWIRILKGVRRAASGKRSKKCLRCLHPVTLGHSCPYLVDEAWEAQAANVSAEAFVAAAAASNVHAENAPVEAFLAAGRGRRGM